MQKLTVTGVRVETLKLPPLRQPIGVGRLSLKAVECVAVFLDTDQGLTGEGLLFALMGARTLKQLVLDLQHLVIGLDPAMSGQFALEAAQETRFLGAPGAAPMAIAGLDMALWDLRGKAANANISQLLGACRTTLPIYNSGGLWAELSMDALLEDAERIISQGFRALKMRLGNSAQEDARRVRAVRDAIGPDIALMVDSNQRWSVKEAIRRGRMLEEFNLAWFEEPIYYRNHAGEAQIREALGMPIASGESEHGPQGMLDMLRQGSVDVLMPDIQRMGGPTGFMQAGAVAEACNIPVSSHLFHEMSASLIACLPGATYLEYMPWFEDLYRERIELNGDGRAIVPTGPGWGFNLDEEAVARYRS